MRLSPIFKMNITMSIFCFFLLVMYSWRTTLATLARPYAYSRFGNIHLLYFDKVDKEIQQKRRAYDNQSGNLDSYNQINESLIDIHNIMRKNIYEVVQRVEKLDRTCTRYPSMQV